MPCFWRWGAPWYLPSLSGAETQARRKHSFLSNLPKWRWPKSPRESTEITSAPTQKSTRTYCWTCSISNLHAISNVAIRDEESQVPRGPQPCQGLYEGWRKVSNSFIPVPFVFSVQTFSPKASLHLESEKKWIRPVTEEESKAEDLSHQDHQPRMTPGHHMQIRRPLWVLVHMSFWKEHLQLAWNFWRRQASRL